MGSEARRQAVGSPTNRLSTAVPQPSEVPSLPDVTVGVSCLPAVSTTTNSIPASTARRLLWASVLSAGLWWSLSGGTAETWVFGIPAVLAATVTAYLTRSPFRWRLSAIGAMRFGAWFAIQSVRGALDVSRRALRWRVDVDPGLRTFAVTLPAGAPRMVFANTITLLPGTLTAELSDDAVVVHVLDVNTDARAELARVEDRVRDLFALPRVPGSSPPFEGEPS